MFYVVLPIKDWKCKHQHIHDHKKPLEKYITKDQISCVLAQFEGKK